MVWDMRKNRRELLIVLIAGMLSAPLAAFAQKPSAMQRIGYLASIRDRNFETFSSRAAASVCESTGAPAQPARKSRGVQ